MAKKKKHRIPKRVAGIKVPKELRKKAEQVLDLADSPAIRQLAGAALMSAAAALAEKQAVRRASARKAGTTSKGDDPAAELRREAAKLAETVRAAAMEGVRRVMENNGKGKDCH